MSELQKTTKRDLGKRQAYRYHEKVQGGNRHLVQSLSELWYPENAIVEELFVLRKVYEMAERKDGRIVDIGKEQDVRALLYLTSEYDFDGELYHRSEDCIARAILRHEDFMQRGLLVKTNIDFVGLTFSGKYRMESLIRAENKDDILHMVAKFNSSLDKIDFDLVELSNKVADLMEHMDKQHKFSVVDGVSIAGGLCSVLSTTSSAVKTIDKLLPGIKNMLLGIQAVLKNI